MTSSRDWDGYVRAQVTLDGMLRALAPLILLARRGDADSAKTVRSIIDDLISRKLTPEKIS